MIKFIPEPTSQAAFEAGLAIVKTDTAFRSPDLTEEQAEILAARFAKIIDEKTSNSEIHETLEHVRGYLMTCRQTPPDWLSAMVDSAVKKNQTKFYA
jgi:hypothetical protein